MNNTEYTPSHGQLGIAAWDALVEKCMVTEAVTPDPNDIAGTMERLITYHVMLDREGPGKVQPVAWVNLQMWQSDDYWPSDCFLKSPNDPDTHVPLYTVPPAPKFDDAMVERIWNALCPEDVPGLTRRKLRTALEAALRNGK